MTAWLLTSTFYGQWLPGDSRGSVTNVRDRRSDDPSLPVRIEHDQLGQDYEDALPGLERAAFERLKGRPVALDLPQAEELLDQLQETANYRRWTLHAVSVMFNHIHLVVEAPPEFGKQELLGDFKSYASRRLNRQFGRPESGTWWTEGGCCRPVQRMPAAVYYVCHRQPNPLVVWSSERGRIPPSESHPDNIYPGDERVLPPLTWEARESSKSESSKSESSKSESSKSEPPA